MSVTFKRFQSNERLSQETVCFTTDVYFNGQKIGTAENRGEGGQALFRKDPKATHEIVAAAEAWAKGQPCRDVHGRVHTFDDGTEMVAGGLEDYCDDAASLLHINKQELARLKRVMKNHTAFLDPAEPGEIFQLKSAYNGEQTKTAVEKRYPGAVVLNALTPEEALQRVRESDLVKENLAKPASGKKPKGP